MKLIDITEDITLVIDNIAYLSKLTDTDGTYSYVAVDTTGTSYELTEEQYNEAKNYLTEDE